MARRRKKRKPPAASRFQVGDRVRVKPGTMDADYADMPLGGWAGSIADIDPFGIHTVRWSDETIASIDPAYKRRCERDGLVLEEYWLKEADLEPEPGGPLCIEQPHTIGPRPLSPDDQDDRVRMVFGLTADDPLPKPAGDSLETYFNYLSERLRFPFSARYETGTLFDPGPPRRVKVKSLDSDWRWDEEDGVLCEVDGEDELEALPLARLSVRRSHANYPLVDDYTAWFDGELPWAEEDEEEEGGEDEEDGGVPDEDELLEQFRNAPWSAAVFPAVGLAVLAGFAGATIGSAVAAMSWAKWGAGIGAVLVGCFSACTFHSFGERKRTQLPPVSVRVLFHFIAGAFGTLLGALLGIMVVAFVGASAGWVFGYLIRRQWGRLETLRVVNPLSFFLAAGGVVGQAFYLNHNLAVKGLLLGASACAAVAVLTVAAVVLVAKVGVPREAAE